jgi:GntR family transcriptional regulator
VEHLSIKLSEASGVPFYRQIVDQVAQLIRSGQLGPGCRLPSVRELAGRLLVSLITVRRAYADLEAAGLIVRRQGHGTYVADAVETASREQALAEAREKLTDAVSQAERLGLSREAIEKMVNDLLSRQGEDHGSK